MRTSIYQWLIYAAAGVGLFGQATSTVGVVTKIDTAAQQLVVKTDAGSEVTVTMQPAASYRRTKPGETDLRNAATIASPAASRASPSKMMKRQGTSLP